MDTIVPSESGSGKELANGAGNNMMEEMSHGDERITLTSDNVKPPLTLPTEFLH